MTAWTTAFVGGLLIGAAVIGLRASTGAIAGISGMFGRALLPGQGSLRARAPAIAFLAGLVLVGALFTLRGRTVDIPTAPLTLLLGGFLVGLGTRLGSGCTSGHGICGNARGSLRSLVATLTFMAFGVAAVALLGGRG